MPLFCIMPDKCQIMTEKCTSIYNLFPILITVLTPIPTLNLIPILILILIPVLNLILMGFTIYFTRINEITKCTRSQKIEKTSWTYSIEKS